MQSKVLTSSNHGNWGNPHQQYDKISEKVFNLSDVDGNDYCNLITLNVTEQDGVKNSVLWLRFKFSVLEAHSENFYSLATFSGELHIRTSNQAMIFMSQKNFNLYDSRETESFSNTNLICYYKNVGTSESPIYEAHLVLYWPGNYKRLVMINPEFSYGTNNTDKHDFIVQSQFFKWIEQTQIILSKLNVTFESKNDLGVSGYNEIDGLINTPMIENQPMTYNGDKTFVSGNYAFRVTQGGIAYSSDGGKTWTFLLKIIENLTDAIAALGGSNS
ncbi:hypothetical protein [Liquorilactobacillus ghanensis]|uniref:hypothetical protein n=1 Tax=Liquorilactobacillus ghanensis TaxID=399370 RepID=UPI0039ED1136